MAFYMSYRVPYGAPSLGLKIDLFLSAVLVRGKARQTYHKNFSSHFNLFRATRD